MPRDAHNGVHDLKVYDDPQAALARIMEIYRTSTATICSQIDALCNGGIDGSPANAFYPYVGIEIGPSDHGRDTRLAYGNLPSAGSYGTTVTRPDLFRSYLLEQMELLLRNYGRSIVVGVSDCPIPLTFVTETGLRELAPERLREVAAQFAMPDLSRIDDSIPNGTFTPQADAPRPLALFSAERVDLSLVRLAHYTGTAPEHFQRFVLFTNYQRYVDEFVAYGHEQVRNGDDYRAFVEPGNVYTPNLRLTERQRSGEAPRHLPQMPAYHLVREKHEGITLINIGVGPSNAKTITDHVAVLRPHCWLMVGHCGGLRKTQRLGDYVLAHAYVRGDNVLDEDLPPWVPVPPIAEVQIAMTEAVAQVTGLKGRELKSRLRTGTVYTTDDRDWELRHDVLSTRFNQLRAIAVDMESATIAANGFRLRVPYGTLLCVSDKPLHGEIKLPGMANTFYNQSISQHLEIGIATICYLREAGVEALHSRKLRSIDEPAFR